ncbi:hypothetical protein AgCh_023434 [Apium graveolens]
MPELVDFTEHNFVTWYATLNGLICLSTSFTDYKPENYNSEIFVWNPTVRKFITLPDSPRLEIPEFGDYCQVKLAFRFFPGSLDFKVVKIVHDSYYKNKSEATLVDVYTRSTNSWKTISQENVIRPLYFDRSDGVFVGASAFWLGGGKIVCFDTDNDVMREIDLPESTDVMSFSIRASGESLALFARNLKFTVLNMWILEGGLANNEIVWKKKFDFCLKYENWLRFELGMDALGFRNNGEHILDGGYWVSEVKELHQRSGIVSLSCLRSGETAGSNARFLNSKRSSTHCQSDVQEKLTSKRSSRIYMMRIYNGDFSVVKIEN